MPYEWLEPFPAAPAKGTQYGAVGYDEVREETVTFGGVGCTADFGLSTLSDETWVWDGALWTKKFPAHSPVGMNDCAMAWSPADNALIFWGGSADSGRVSETWKWDGTDWTQLSPTHSPSAVARIPAMATAPGKGNIVMWSSIIAGVGSTWLWDGSDWLIQSPAHDPGNLNSGGMAMAYDRTRGYPILYGGHNGAGYNTDVWRWSGTDWLQTSASPNPGKRSDHGLAWLDCAECVALWGGATDVGGLPASVWLWDGATWTEVSLGTEPDGRLGPNLGGHEANGDLVLIHTDHNLSSSLCGASTWTFECPAIIESAAISHRFGLQ